MQNTAPEIRVLKCLCKIRKADKIDVVSERPVLGKTDDDRINGGEGKEQGKPCLLYTSDAADD